MIFVRHGRAVVQPDVPTSDWPLDPAFVGDVAQVQRTLPELPVVCSDMLRAIETARFFGEPRIDPRLAEVSRPWADHDFDGSVARYLRGDAIVGWEPQADARARIAAAVAEHGEAVYVTHGTLLTLHLVSVVPTLSALPFWEGLRLPDAWQVDGTRIERISA